jgi:hypothetical protein
MRERGTQRIGQHMRIMSQRTSAIALQLRRVKLPSTCNRAQTKKTKKRIHKN